MQKNGVDCVEVSASVGYLLSEFLSPRTNLRTDIWGGDDKKRMRFPTEVLKAIRNAVGPDFPVIIKISGGDMLGGYDNDYMAKFLNQLPSGTVNGVTVTGGWHEAPVPQISYHVSPGGFSYLSGEIKEKTGLTVIACNRINSPQIAEELLQKGDCDFVGAARPFLADPDFVNKSRKGIPYNRCQACNRGCIENALKKNDVCCVFNPEAGREYFRSAKTPPQKLLIIGAGPVGLQAAKTASERGHIVTIITDDSRLGGKLHIADKAPFKQMFSTFADYLEHELRKNNVTILTGVPISEEIIRSEKPDFIIFASGASPIMPEICKESQMPCVSAEQILSESVKCPNQNIVIIGGGSVGLETAEFLGEKYGKKGITVVELQPKAGKGLVGLKWIMMKHLKELGVRIVTSAEVSEISHNKVILTIRGEKAEKEKEEIYADMIVYAVGYKPNGTLGLRSYLEKENIPYVIIGDAGRTKDLLEGLADAYITAENI